MNTVTLVYERGSLSAAELDRAARQILVDEGIEGVESITFKEGQGADPLTIVIVVSIVSKLSELAAEKLWDEVVVPKLRRRHADDAVGRRDA